MRICFCLRASLFLFCVFSLFLFHAHARVVISEVMYDPPGRDDWGRAWLEIINDGTAPFFVADLSLFSEGTSYPFRSFSDSSLLLPGEVAVVAQDSGLFFESYPDYTGSVFVSDVVLPHDGGSLGLSDSRGSDFSFSYLSDERSAGTGGSLHVLRDGRQVVGAATPGVVAVNPIVLANPPVSPPSPESVKARVGRFLSERHSDLSSDTPSVSCTPSSEEVCFSCVECRHDSSSVFFWIAVALFVVAFEFFVFLLFLFFRFRSVL